MGERQRDVGGKVSLRAVRIRRACRYRVGTEVVPEGRLVRHPRCPLCAERLGYVARDGGATFLHIDDPWFRMTVVD